MLLLAAWVYARATGFDPFRTGEVDYASAAPMAVLLTVAAFLLQPVVVQLVRLFWLGKGGAPEQVNYTQGWAQAVVVIPLMAAAYLMAAVLWGEARGEAGPPALASIESYGGVRHRGLALLAVPAVGRVRVAVAAVVLLGAQPARLARSRGGHRGAARRGARVPPAAQRDHGCCCAAGPAIRGARCHAFVWAPPLVAMAYFLTIVVLIGIIGPPVHRGRARMVEPPGRLARHLRRRLDGDRGVRGLRSAAGRAG